MVYKEGDTVSLDEWCERCVKSVECCLVFLVSPMHVWGLSDNFHKNPPTPLLFELCNVHMEQGDITVCRMALYNNPNNFPLRWKIFFLRKVKTRKKFKWKQGAIHMWLMEKMPPRKRPSLKRKSSQKKSSQKKPTRKPSRQHTMSTRSASRNNRYNEYQYQRSRDRYDEYPNTYNPGVRTHWGDPNNNWLLPQAGYLGRDSSGREHTGTNWLGTEVDWTWKGVDWVRSR